MFLYGLSNCSTLKGVGSTIEVAGSYFPWLWRGCLNFQKWPLLCLLVIKLSRCIMGILWFCIFAKGELAVLTKWWHHITCPDRTLHASAHTHSFSTTTSLILHSREKECQVFQQTWIKEKILLFFVQQLQLLIETSHNLSLLSFLLNYVTLTLPSTAIRTYQEMKLRWIQVWGIWKNTEPPVWLTLWSGHPVTYKIILTLWLNFPVLMDVQSNFWFPLFLEITHAAGTPFEHLASAANYVNILGDYTPTRQVNTSSHGEWHA